MVPSTALIFVVFLFGMTSALNVIRQDVYDEIKDDLNNFEQYFIFKLDGTTQDARASLVERGTGYEKFKKQLAASTDMRYGYILHSEGSCFERFLIFWDVEGKPIAERVLYAGDVEPLAEDLNVDEKYLVETEAEIERMIQNIFEQDC